MAKTLYVSTDDNSIHKPEHIDPPINTDYYWPIEVPDTITLTPDQVCGAYGSIVEILLRAKMGKKK